MLEGQNFYVYTDHKPLIYALNAKPDKYTPRDIRQLDYISQYTTSIRYMKGDDNTVVDMLSRTWIEAIDDGLSFELIADEQHKGQTLDQLKNNT